MKRFYLADIFTEPNKSYQQQRLSDLNDLHKYRLIRYVCGVEISFYLSSDHGRYGNRIAIPLLILDYAERNLSSTFDRTHVDFMFKVSFTKAYRFGTILDVTLSTLLVICVALTIFETYCYKTRQQRLTYDFDIFTKFVVYLCGNVSDALFGCTIILSVYVLIVHRTQQVIRIMLPLQEQNVLEIFTFVAVALKVSIYRLFRVWSKICFVFSGFKLGAGAMSTMQHRYILH